MSLEASIFEIQSEYIALRNSLEKNLEDEGRFALEKSYSFEKEKIKSVILEHFNDYPLHREISLGNKPTFEEQATSFLQKEFGIKTWKGQQKYGEDGNARYKGRTMHFKKYNRFIQDCQLTKDISSVISGFEENITIKPFGFTGKWRKVLLYGLFVGSMASGPALVAILDLMPSLGIPAGMVLFGSALGSMGYGMPFPTTINNYLLGAKRADKLLQHDIKPYLVQELHPYRSPA